MSVKSKNIDKIDDIPTNTPPKLIEYDKQVLNIAEAHPDWSLNQIDCQVAKVRGVEHSNRIYKRLKKSDYLRTELARIQEYHRQCQTREIMPLAVQKHKKLLKDRDLPKGLQLSAVKLAYDAEWKIDQPSSTQGTTINIKDLKVLINKDISS